MHIQVTGTMVSFIKGFTAPAARRGTKPSPYDFIQTQLYSLRKPNPKLSIYHSANPFLLLLHSLISNATSDTAQHHFTAAKHKTYFIILSNNYIVCLPVHSHEHITLKNSTVSNSSHRYWKEQTSQRALKHHRAFLMVSGRLRLVQTYGSTQNTMCFISEGCALDICCWLLNFDHHLNSFELVSRYTFLIVEKSSSSRKSIFHSRITNKLV